MASNTYDEQIASVSPAKAGFSRTGGQAELPLWVASGDITAAITRILGSVLPKDDGRLERGLPVQHPQFPWMTAVRITNIQGRGAPAQTASVQPTVGEALNYYSLYPWYLYNVQFAHEAWLPYKDDDILVVDTTYVDDSGVDQPTVYAQEYFRFTEQEFIPDSDVITATYGQQKFRTQSGNDPDEFTFPGAPYMILGKAVVKFKWHFVPFSFVTHSRSAIVWGLGRINQVEFLGYPPGSLLYRAVNVKRYMPPVPFASIEQGQVSFSNDYVADIEFLCEYVDREGEDLPTPSQDDWLAAGHNLFPWINTRKFYYVTGTDGSSGDSDNSKWRPNYRSFLFQWLFTNPAVLPD